MIDEDDHELAERLGRLGAALDLDDHATARLVDAVLARVDHPDRAQSGRRWLGAAAVVLLAIALATTLVPDARRAVARWFGLTGVQVDVDPEVSSPALLPTFDEPGPGESRVVTVDGREILVSAVSGALDEVLINKTVGSSTQVMEVAVNGRPGLWVAGAAHEVLYRTLDGEVLVDRAAADTLLWQDGDVLYRVEGFTTLADALALAAKITSGT